MSYTVGQLRKAAEQAMGGAGNVPSGFSLDLVLLSALDRLAGAHDWRWLTERTTLTLTVDTATVDLPAGFNGLISITGTASNQYRFEPTSLATLADLQTQTPTITPAGTGQVYVYAIGTASQASASANRPARLHLYPTPAATEAGAIVLFYRRGLTVPAADTSSVDIDSTANAALIALVRAEAAAAVIATCPPPALKQRQLVQETYEAQANRELDSLRNRDGLLQPSLGISFGTTQMLGTANGADDRFFPTSSATLA